MSGLFPEARPDINAQIKEVEREIAMRERVYPRWVESGKMTQAAAARQIENMKAVLSTLTASKGLGAR